jgi:hypothetical protein
MPTFDARVRKQFVPIYNRITTHRSYSSRYRSIQAANQPPQHLLTKAVMRDQAEKRQIL